MTDRAVIYRRVSREEQLRGFSPETQDTDINTFIARRGYTVVGNFMESGTAHELNKRKELTTIRQMMRKGEFEVLVVWKLDRFHRNQMNQAVVMYEARQAGVRVESATEPIDDSPAGQLLAAVYAFKAEQEWEDTRLRTQRNLRARVEAGFPLVGTKAPYGYVWVYESIRGKRRKARLAEDPETAPTVRFIFGCLANEWSLQRVADRLNNDGVPTPKGSATWLRSTVRYIAHNETYTGKAYAYKSRYVETQQVDPLTQERHVTRVRRDSDQPVALPDGVVPPLVMPDVFAAVQARLAHSRSVPTQGKTLDPEVYLLRGGYVVCGVCGNSMSARRRNGRNHFYICHRGWSGDRKHVLTVPVDEVDPLVRGWVIELLRQPEIAEAFLADLESRRAEHTGQTLATLRGLHADTQHEIDNLVASLRHVDNERGRARIGADITELEKQLTGLEQDIQQAESNDAEWVMARKAIARIREYGEPDDYQAMRRVLFDFGVVARVHKPGDGERVQMRSRLLERLSLLVGNTVNTVSFRSGFCPVLTGFTLTVSRQHGWGYEVTQPTARALHQCVASGAVIL
jgi:site-specific DNA recombinase